MQKRNLSRASTNLKHRFNSVQPKVSWTGRFCCSHFYDCLGLALFQYKIACSAMYTAFYSKNMRVTSSWLSFLCMNTHSSVALQHKPLALMRIKIPWNVQLVSVEVSEIRKHLLPPRISQIKMETFLITWNTSVLTLRRHLCNVVRAVLECFDAEHKPRSTHTFSKTLFPMDFLPEAQSTASRKSL